MVAKLASLASKPDGIRVIDGPAALQQLLTNTPASRLPRCGSKVADTLSRAGVQMIADLQVSQQHTDNMSNLQMTCSTQRLYLTRVQLGFGFRVLKF